MARNLQPTWSLHLRLRGANVAQEMWACKACDSWMVGNGFMGCWADFRFLVGRNGLYRFPPLSFFSFLSSTVYRQTTANILKSILLRGRVHVQATAMWLLAFKNRMRCVVSNLVLKEVGSSLATIAYRSRIA